MTRKERLMRTLRGLNVDRPPVSFYEIDGTQDTENPDTFNIFNSEDWKPVINLARERSDRIVSCRIDTDYFEDDPCEELITKKIWNDDSGSLYSEETIHAGGRELIRRTRRDKDVNTLWTEEHFLKDVEDLKAYLSLPPRNPPGKPDISKALSLEKEIGQSGILILETADPLCMAAELFSMDTYMILAVTETELFQNLLERFFEELILHITSVSEALPGRLWRIYGPEYAAPPYLPPDMFRRFVSVYDGELINIIHKNGGFVRVHAHGNIKDVLDDIIATDCDGLDPIEPPPQGDVELKEVKVRCGDRIVLFGNLEASDLENCETAVFERKIRTALEEGTGGRGFVLMPSSCPYGRILKPHVLPNYEAMIRLSEEFAG